MISSLVIPVYAYALVPNVLAYHADNIIKYLHLSFDGYRWFHIIFVDDVIQNGLRDLEKNCWNSSVKIDITIANYHNYTNFSFQTIMRMFEVIRFCYREQLYMSSLMIL